MHRIRLRGFWEISEPTPGRVRFERRFGKPTTIAGQVLNLVIEGMTEPVDVELNGRSVMSDQLNRFPLAELLVRNLVAIEMIGTLQTVPPDVSIEID